MERQPEAANPDANLITSILNGEKQLYGELMRKYNSRLYRICFSVLQNEELVEETMQSAYVRAYERLEQFRFESSFGTWLTRIALNICFAHQNRQRRLKMHAAKEENVSDVETPYHKMINQELRHMLEEAVNGLPEKYRTVFVMREVEDMSIAETVECLGLSETNVKVRLSRAKEMLREKLDAWYRDAELYPFHLDRCDGVVRKVMGRI